MKICKKLRKKASDSADMLSDAFLRDKPAGSVQADV